MHTLAIKIMHFIMGIQTFNDGQIEIWALHFASANYTLDIRFTLQTSLHKNQGTTKLSASESGKRSKYQLVKVNLPFIAYHKVRQEFKNSKTF